MILTAIENNTLIKRINGFNGNRKQYTKRYNDIDVSNVYVYDVSNVYEIHLQQQEKEYENPTH